MRLCSVEGCNKIHNAHGYCSMHYHRMKKYGDLLPHTKVIGENREKHPLRKTYKNMLARCYNPNISSYKWYGARGIKVCDRWLGLDGFTHFINDIGKKPSPKHSLDRIDNNGNYEPGNCRWATAYEQMAHTRRWPIKERLNG